MGAGCDTAPIVSVLALLQTSLIANIICSCQLRVKFTLKSWSLEKRADSQTLQKSYLKPGNTEVRQSFKMKHSVQEMAGGFLGCDFSAWSLASVELTFSSILGLISTMPLLCMLSPDSVKEFWEDCLVLIVESNTVETDSAHEYLWSVKLPSSSSPDGWCVCVRAWP